jgi:hypothetical protein
MSDFDRTGVHVDVPVRRRPGSSRLTDRLARTFGGFDRTQAELPGWEDGSTVEYAALDQPDDGWPAYADRFPISRHGYDRAAVDHHLAALERELTELRDGKPVSEAISAEIERFGEQTAAILRVAHEQAHETRRSAHAEADRCLADAAQNALAITNEAHQRLQQLDAETDQVWRERARLIDDVRTVATSLLALADEASERFPAEGNRVDQPMAAPAPAPPAPQPAPVSYDNGTSASEDDGIAGLA